MIAYILHGHMLKLAEHGKQMHKSATSCLVLTLILLRPLATCAHTCNSHECKPTRRAKTASQQFYISNVAMRVQFASRIGRNVQTSHLPFPFNSKLFITDPAHETSRGSSLQNVISSLTQQGDCQASTDTCTTVYAAEGGKREQIFCAAKRGIHKSRLCATLQERLQLCTVKEMRLKELQCLCCQSRKGRQ